MFAIVDVYNRGGAFSLGTIVKVSQRRFSLKSIDSFASTYSNYPRSGGFVPCVGVRLRKNSGNFYEGVVIQDGHCMEIYGSEHSLKSIQNVPDVLEHFGLEALLNSSSTLEGFNGKFEK